jgi:DNA-binding MarR family transcriptional regulator
MTFKLPAEPAGERRRRRLTNDVKARLRAAGIQLSLLNQQVGTHVDLRASDIGCLDIIGIHGPLSPSALARHTGMHPATLTGVLDRLEKGGWVVRERDESDRRAVVIRALHDRAPEMFRLYSGMSTSVDGICSGYDETQLELLADFLGRVEEAGQQSTSDLSARPS